MAAIAEASSPEAATGTCTSDGFCSRETRAGDEDEREGTGKEGRRDQFQSLIAKGRRDRGEQRGCEGGEEETDLRSCRRRHVLAAVEPLRVHVLVEPSDTSTRSRRRSTTVSGGRARVVVRGHVVEGVAASGPSSGRKTTRNDRRRPRNELAVVLVLCVRERAEGGEEGQRAARQQALLLGRSPLLDRSLNIDNCILHRI